MAHLLTSCCVCQVLPSQTCQTQRICQRRYASADVCALGVANLFGKGACQRCQFERVLLTDRKRGSSEIQIECVDGFQLCRTDAHKLRNNEREQLAASQRGRGDAGPPTKRTREGGERAGAAKLCAKRHTTSAPASASARAQTTACVRDGGRNAQGGGGGGDVAAAAAAPAAAERPDSDRLVGTCRVCGRGERALGKPSSRNGLYRCAQHCGPAFLLVKSVMRHRNETTLRATYGAASGPEQERHWGGELGTAISAKLDGEHDFFHTSAWTGRRGNGRSALEALLDETLEAFFERCPLKQGGA